MGVEREAELLLKIGNEEERRTGTAKEEKYWPNIWSDTLAEAKVIFLSMQKATNIFKISGPLKPEPSLIQRWVLH